MRDAGHEAYSNDLVPADDGSPYHLQCDCRDVVNDGWDMLIAHPVCKRLANSGARWLHERDLWADLEKAVEFYLVFRNAKVPKIAIENPVMRCHATERLGRVKRHIVQPWWFGDPFFKATGFELKGLPALTPTNKLVPPAKGTAEHKRWSYVHLLPPSPDRERLRSQSFPGMARAMARQWGSL